MKNFNTSKLLMPRLLLVGLIALALLGASCSLNPSVYRTDSKYKSWDVSYGSLVFFEYSNVAGNRYYSNINNGIITADAALVEEIQTPSITGVSQAGVTTIWTQNGILVKPAGDWAPELLKDNTWILQDRVGETQGALPGPGIVSYLKKVRGSYWESMFDKLKNKRPSRIPLSGQVANEWKGPLKYSAAVLLASGGLPLSAVIENLRKPNEDGTYNPNKDYNGKIQCSLQLWEKSGVSIAISITCDPGRYNPEESKVSVGSLVRDGEETIVIPNADDIVTIKQLNKQIQDASLEGTAGGAGSSNTKNP